MPLGGYRGAEFRQKPKMMAGHKESMNNSKQYKLCTTECNASKHLTLNYNEIHMKHYNLSAQG